MRLAWLVIPVVAWTAAAQAAEPASSEPVKGMKQEAVAAKLAGYAEQLLDRFVWGDIIPVQGRGTKIYPPREAKMESQVTPVVVVSPSVGPITNLTSSASQSSQSLLTSGDPASVVVGNRLLRTRIVGNPGAAYGTATGVRFNPQSRGFLDFGFGR